VFNSFHSSNRRRSTMIPKLSIIFLGIFIDFGNVEGHGRIMEPPMRASLWRFEEFEYLNPPVMYDDDAFWCGGYVTQHQTNGGKCGLCEIEFYFHLIYVIKMHFITRNVFVLHRWRQLCRGNSSKSRRWRNIWSRNNCSKLH